MKLSVSRCFLVFAIFAICFPSLAHSETPAIAVVLKAPKNSTYEQVVPILRTLKKMEIWEKEE